jgi:hypothetical protein
LAHEVQTQWLHLKVRRPGFLDRLPGVTASRGSWHGALSLQANSPAADFPKVLGFTSIPKGKLFMHEEFPEVVVQGNAHVSHVTIRADERRQR